MKKTYKVNNNYYITEDGYEDLTDEDLEIFVENPNKEPLLGFLKHVFLLILIFIPWFIGVITLIKFFF